MNISELQTVLGLISEYTDTIESGFDGELCFTADLPPIIICELLNLEWDYVKIKSTTLLIWYKNVHNT